MTLEKNITRFRFIYFCLINIIFPWKKTWPFDWQTWNQGCFVPYWLTLDQLPLEKKMLSMYISYLFISNLTLERHVPLHLYKIDSLKLRIHCAQISWNLLRGSKEEDSEMLRCIFFLLKVYPLWNGDTGHLNELEWTSAQQTLCRYGW